MEQMFRAAFERMIGFISMLIVTGLIVAWSIDMQRKAARQTKTGLISLTRINNALMGKGAKQPKYPLKSFSKDATYPNR